MSSSAMKLFSPVSIGTMTLRNRIVMAPITTNYGTEDQEPSERLVRYLEERAKGGVGLITAEVCSVDLKHRYQTNSLSLAHDRYIDQHRQLVDVIHRHGAKIQPQITHPGPESMSIWMEDTPGLGPSSICGLGNRPPCRELALEELPAIVEQYAQAARRAQEAGYDGMELHAAHAYMLLASFLTPWRNKRSDEYGGKKPEGRFRFLLEVIRAMKQSTGGNFPLTLRISGYERLKGGRELNETQAMAPIMVEAGVDAFHLTGGYAGDAEAASTICGSEYDFGYNVSEAKALKQVVDVPVMAVGRIHDPKHAEQILQSGGADLVVMGRPLLADPELPLKAQQGRFQEIRRCISCQNCVDTLIVMDMNCAVNARSGRETQYSVGLASSSKKVLVIGGGTAGMEAARVAALRGHRVTLCEQGQRLGGSLTLASTVHSDNEAFLSYLTGEVKRLPISLRLGHKASPAFVRDFAPDAVIVASGMRLEEPKIPGADLPQVLSGSQMRRLLSGDVQPVEQGVPAWMTKLLQLAGDKIQRHITPQRLRQLSKLWMPLGSRVAIIGADLAGIELAEFLAERGREVFLLDEGKRIALDVGLRRRADHMDRLDRLGVIVNTSVTVERITPEGVWIQNQLGGKHRVEVDSVILSGTPVADTRLFEEISPLVPEAYAIGDCTGLGLIAKATTEAMRVACLL